MSKIAVSIVYVGLQLQVLENERGERITPLKPISDLLGLGWQRQREKVLNSAFLLRRLGISGTPRYTSNPTYGDELFIRVDRVATYLMTINPDQVRAQGNTDGADFLEQKIAEWDDALHDYEELGVAVNLRHAKTLEVLRRQRLSFAHMIGVKNKTPDAQDRQALSQVIGQMASELGVPYQLDLADTGQPSGGQ